MTDILALRLWVMQPISSAIIVVFYPTGVPVYIYTNQTGLAESVKKVTTSTPAKLNTKSFYSREGPRLLQEINYNRIQKYFKILININYIFFHLKNK